MREMVVAREGGSASLHASIGSVSKVLKKGMRSWAGMGALVIIVPISLLVPSGHYENRFYLKDGKCVGLVSEYGEVSQIYGFMWADNGGGFVAGTRQAGSGKFLSTSANKDMNMPV